MTLNITASWHKESYDRFLLELLPQLLADRLPLLGYHAAATGDYACCINVTLASASGDIEVIYTDIPLPDETGVFKIEDVSRLVVPRASQEELDTATISCVGEQLYDYIAERLGEAPPDLPWDQSLMRAWLPLNALVHEFFATSSQVLDSTNWLAVHQHLRRIFIKDRQKMFTPGHFGRTCPFETPEGPNIGRYLSIALGAAIHNGKLVVEDERPEAAIGLSAAMIPFLEHNDPNRLLMGTNMMRQWLAPPDPEPALVQTGSEPAAADFWCGRNLLTAYISWGADTFEDGIVISESCAKRLNYCYSVGPGDKLSNRHGTKGVISRVLPDEEMPHLADGTPVELVFSFISLHRRLFFGQLREATMSRIARSEGSPAIVPPFHAPAEDELRARLVGAGLREDGMDELTVGRDGKKLLRPSTVGWVYWGRLIHVAHLKLKSAVDKTFSVDQDELAYYALRDAAAFESIIEHFNTASAHRADAETLARRVELGKVEQAAPPTPMFSNLVRRLLAAGIRVVLENERLTFSFAVPEGTVLKLARPVAHPWLPERTLTEIGAFDELPEFAALVEANTRLERVLTSQAPASLAKKALAQLETRLQEFFAALLNPLHLQCHSRVLFSGRAVLVPGANLCIDQVGIAEEMAWTLFGPLVTQQLGSDAEVHARSMRAARALDEIMARSWLLVFRAPAHTLTSFLAFHPVRCPDSAIHLHPLACALLNADFDGDQATVFLPVTEEAQREAGERLSVASHLRRDPGLLKLLAPTDEAIWGLASLHLTPEGDKEIARLLDSDSITFDGPLTRTSLINALQVLLKRDGPDRTLEVIERLMRLGFEVAKESGASMNPFIGTTLQRPPLPQSTDIPLEQIYVDYARQVEERIASRSDFASNDFGPQLLAIKSEAFGSMYQLAALIETRGTVKGLNEEYIQIHHGFSSGLTPGEMYALAISSREVLARLAFQWEQFGQEVSERRDLKGFNVLTRAMRSHLPGVVFALAASMGENDPLINVDSRLFVGLPVVS